MPVTKLMMGEARAKEHSVLNLRLKEFRVGEGRSEASPPFPNSKFLMSQLLGAGSEASSPPTSDKKEFNVG